MFLPERKLVPRIRAFVDHFVEVRLRVHPDLLLLGDKSYPGRPLTGRWPRRYPLGKPLEPISQDAAAFLEDHVVIKSEAGQVAVEEKAA